MNDFVIKNALIGFVFFVLFVLNLIAVKKCWAKFRWVIKPMIVPVIIGLYVFNTDASNFKWIIVLALALGLAGDIFLLFNGAVAFILGLIAFLAGHVVYIALFFNLSGFPDNLHPSVIGFGVLLLISLIPVSILLIKYAKKMAYLVFLYYILLLTMCFSAATLFENKSLLAFCLTMSGSLLFVASDTLLGVRKFTPLIKENSILVMGTYIPAQLLIAIGVIFC